MISRLLHVLGILLVVILYSSPALPETPRLNVEEVVKEAMQNNPEILAAQKKWEVFKAKVPQASALEDPMLGFGIVNLPTNFSFKDEDMTMKEILHLPEVSFPRKEAFDEGDGRERGRSGLSRDFGRRSIRSFEI